MACLTTATPIEATTLLLSDVSSDGTPASSLDAEIDVGVVANTLTLTVTNTSADFDINQIHWNASEGVSGLTVLSATHGVEGDVAIAWLPLETRERAGGFGFFDFALTVQGGENDASLIGSGERVAFVFSISGVGPYGAQDFVEENRKGWLAAAKFVHGPGDDSAFGATATASYGGGGPGVPEPNVGWLVALAALAAWRRRGLR